jgi:hypothetical protein
MLQINLSLYLLGWRVFDVSVGESWSGYTLARGSRARGDIVEVRRVTDRVFMTFEPQTLSLGELRRTRLSSHLDLIDSHASRRLYLRARASSSNSSEACPLRQTCQ